MISILHVDYWRQPGRSNVRSIRFREISTQPRVRSCKSLFAISVEDRENSILLNGLLAMSQTLERTLDPISEDLELTA